MACMDPKFVVRCKDAERRWIEVQQMKDCNDRYEIEDALRFGFEYRTVALAAEHLSSKNVTVVQDRSGFRIDFQNPEHLRCLYIAHKIGQICDLNPDDAKIALEMKEKQLVAQEKIDNKLSRIATVVRGVEYHMEKLLPYPAGLIGSYAFGINKYENPYRPITAEELLHAYPDGIPAKDLPYLLGLHLDKRARDAVEKRAADELAALSKIVRGNGEHEELEKTYQPVQEANTVLPPRPDEVLGPNGSTEIAQNELKLPTEMTPTINGQGEASSKKDTRASDLAKKLTAGLVQMVTAYHAIDERDQRYQAERRRLREGFEYVCDDFGMKYNLDTFVHHNATQVFQRFCGDGVTDTLAERARQVHHLSDSVSKNVSDLQKELKDCRAAHSTYTGLDERLTNLSRNLANFYDRKLKELEQKAKVFSIIQAAASLCSDLPGLSVLSQAAGSASAHIDAKRSRRMKRYTESLNRSEEGKRLIGVLDSQTVIKMSALLASEKEEQEHLISIRQHLDPVVYVNLLTDLSNGYAEQKKEKKNELEKEDQNLKKLEEDKAKLKNGKYYTERERDICVLEAKIEESKRRIKDGQTTLESLDVTISRNSLERELAEYVSPISKIKREILQELEGSLPDEKTLRSNQEFREVFKLLSDSIKEGFYERQQVLNCLVPLINNLQAFAEIRESSFGLVLNKAGIAIKIGNDLNVLGNEILTLKNFARVVSTKGERDIPWNLIVPQLIIPISSGLAAMTSIMYTLHTMNNPEKDPMKEALAKLGEDIVRVQKDLFQNQLRALSNHCNNLSHEIQDSANNVITEIKKEQSVILDRIDTGQDHQYEISITDLIFKIEHAGRLENLDIFLGQSKKKEVNGVSQLKTFGEATRFLVENPSIYTGYLYQTVSEQNSLPPNLSLFKAIVARAVQLSEKGGCERRDIDFFLTNAQKELCTLYQLSNFSLRALERAIDRLEKLRTYVRSLSPHDNSDPLDSVAGLKCEVDKFASLQLEGSAKFVRGYWGDKNIVTLYDQKVKEMHGTYVKELKKTKEIVLPSSSGKLIPLIFPRHYIEALERELAHIRTKLAYLNVGTLTLSSYDFQPSNENVELILQWKVTLNKGNPRQYVEAVVASFDSKSVNAFKNESEFLIQAMHCGKYGLGLPGKGTKEGETGKLFVVERKFIGLYPFFHSREEGGKMGCFYNSEDNNGTILQTADDFKQSCVIEPYNAFASKVKFNIDEKGFFAVEAAVMGRTNQLLETDVYREYRRSYHELQALCRLQLGASKEDLQREMMRHFSLLPLNNPDFLQKGTPPPSDLVVSAWDFNRTLGNGQGLLQELKKLEEDLKKLQSIHILS